MIREDREMLVELARLNGDMPSLALRIMDGSASAAEQQHYAQRLIAMGEQLRRRTGGMQRAVIEGEVTSGSATFPAHTIELDGNREQRLGDTVSGFTGRARRTDRVAQQRCAEIAGRT